MRSDAARMNSSICREDVFFDWTPGMTSVKRKVIARTLDKHVRWWQMGDLEDNFVS